MDKYISEMFGTFALVFVGTAAIVTNEFTGGDVSHVGISLAFGLVVMAMIFAIGDRSGAHINPAVTISFWLAGRIKGKEVGPYVVAQLVGALAASGVVLILFYEFVSDTGSSLGATLPDGSWWQALVFEIILTFILMFVILNVSHGPREKGLTAGIAVGGTVALCALIAGPITGASMNPARSIGPAVFSGELDTLWIYLVAPVFGAALAVPLCWCVHDDECCTISIGCEEVDENSKVA